MSNFYREGSTVKVDLEVDCCSDVKDRYPHFTYVVNDDLSAELLVQAYNKQFDRWSKEIKQDAYETGWKDAKSKKKKETFFDWCFKHRFNE